MKTVSELIEQYTRGVSETRVSGFEVLELLDIRSRIAEYEQTASRAERRRIELADRQFFRNAMVFAENIRQIADFTEMRTRANVPPSHWWWYVDEMTRVALAA